MLTVSYDSVTLGTVESNWTLDELSRRVAVALSVGYGGQRSGRVREVPDARVIRYYGTLGLVDRPVLEGRTALYGVRHLEQIVAIKRLQADGHPLSEVQRRLHGVTGRELARIARLPAEALADVVSAPAPEEKPDAEPAMRGQAFWTERPAEMPAFREDKAKQAKAAEVSAPAPHQEKQPIAVRLAEGVTLLFEATRAVSQADVEAIRQAAEALLETMTRNALTGGK